MAFNWTFIFFHLSGLLRQFRTDKPIQAHPSLGSLYGQFAMNFRRNPNDEFTAELFGRNWFRQRFVAFLHILDDLCNDLANASQSSFRSARQPTQTGKFRTQAKVLLIFIGPHNAVSVTIIFQ